MAQVNRSPRRLLGRRRALRGRRGGMLSVTLGKLAALVGVAISITTIPAAADIGLSLAYGDRDSFRGSALQLALNIISLLVAATITLAIQRVDLACE